MRTIFALAGLGLVGGALVAQRQAPPTPGTPKDFRLPARTTITLPNGMQLSMVAYGVVPKVAVNLEIRSGAIDEGLDETQLSALTADLLLEGTISRSSSDIARDVAQMGGSLSTSVTTGTDVGGEVLSEYAEQFVRLIADVAQHPRFAEADVTRLVANRVRDNAIALSQPEEQARQRFGKMIFPDHPYGRLYPSAATLQSYSVDRVRDFYAKNFGARRAHLYVAGVFDRARVERAVREAFSGWAPGAAPTANPPTAVDHRQLDVVSRPGAVQSTVWLGLPVADPSNADWVRIDVTNALLGGAFGSRITRNIREDKGYTYSPFSFLWQRPGVALWIEAADVTSNVTGPSLKEIFYEIDRLRTTAPPDSELLGIERNSAGLFVIRNSSRTGVINQLHFVDHNGLGDAFLSNYVKNVFAVTPDQVRQTAQRYFDPARMTITIVGDDSVIDAQIAPYRTAAP
jgi:zinc protease